MLLTGALARPAFTVEHGSEACEAQLWQNLVKLIFVIIAAGSLGQGLGAHHALIVSENTAY